jgi:RES domain-containing protein
VLTYRITQTRYAHLLTSPGLPGRWNHEGRDIIYTGGSAALSCLEVTVHKTGASLHSGNYSISTFNIPDNLAIEEIRIEDLTKTAVDWYTVENYLITQRMSDEWLKSGNSVVLKVPSAIIQNEFNYLLNVNHPDFSKIHIVNISRFTFDPRLKTS